MATEITPVDIGTIISEIQTAVICHRVAEGLIVETHCLYPTNDVVTVEIHGGLSYCVTDRGRAIDLAASLGIPINHPGKLLKPHAARYDLQVSNDGKIFISDVPPGMLPTAIAFVANASKEAAHAIIDRQRAKPRDELRQKLYDMVRPIFPHRAHRNFPLQGKSSRTHTFDCAISGDPLPLALFNTVVDEANAINAVVVAGVDVVDRYGEALRPWIVFDAARDWRADSLSLLQAGGTPVALSALPRLLSEKGLNGSKAPAGQPPSAMS